MNINSKFYLVIKTNEYTGNFDRELMAFVFGVDLNNDGYADKYLKLFELEMGDITKDRFSKYFDYVSGEYGEEVCAFADSHPTNKKYDCDSMYVVLKEKLPQPLYDVVQYRLKRYCKLYEKVEHKNLQILDMNYYQNKLTKTDEEVL